MEQTQVKRSSTDQNFMNGEKQLNCKNSNFNMY